MRTHRNSNTENPEQKKPTNETTKSCLMMQLFHTGPAFKEKKLLLEEKFVSFMVSYPVAFNKKLTFNEKKKFHKL